MQHLHIQSIASDLAIKARPALQGATAMAGGVQFVRERDFKIWEVALASSAAPSYFPGEHCHLLSIYSS